MNETIVLVNEQDEITGETEKLKAHQEGLLHRAFSVFVLRLDSKRQIELLLQQRQINKYHSGGLWTNTCCSHPKPGEDIIAAAQRRLSEEMGLNIPLTFLGKFYYRADFENGLTEHEWDYVFIGQWKGEEIKFDSNEVQNFTWENLDHIIADLNLNSEKYTFWFEKALNFVIKKRGIIAQTFHSSSAP